MQLSLFDTHCDTASELLYKHQSIRENNCHIDLNKAAVYRSYAQFFAVWSKSRFDDQTAWTEYLKVAENFKDQVAKNADIMVIADSAKEITDAWNAGKRIAIPAIEDARLLCGDLSRLKTVRDMGVRYLTLLWSGDTIIGGSHNTQHGLTDFGRQVVNGCFDLGIVPDVSHSSEQVVDEVVEIAKARNKPFMASHSNAYAVHPHSRNLRDRHFEAIRDLGGIVGINLYVDFLTDTSVRPATLDDIVTHIDHFMELGGEDVIGIGGDLDGCDLPTELSHVGDLTKIADTLARHNYSEELIQKIFWKNFLTFVQKQF